MELEMAPVVAIVAISRNIKDRNKTKITIANKNNDHHRLTISRITMKPKSHLQLKTLITMHLNSTQHHNQKPKLQHHHNPQPNKTKNISQPKGLIIKT